MDPLVMTIAAVVGAFIGLLGGGGSILAVPLLVRGGGMPVPLAIAGCLALVLAAAAAATAVQARAGLVAWNVVAAFGSLGVVGSFAGARAARHVDPRVQLELLWLLMVVVGWRMLAGRGESPARPPAGRAGRGSLAALALAVGALTGLLGAGGGFIVVPALVVFAGLPVRRAVASSVAVLAVTSAGALAGHLAHVELAAGLWVPAAACAAGAGAAGALAARRVPELALRRGFGVLALVLAVLQRF